MTKKQLSNSLKSNVKFRRRWMTFLRMTRYGINNFSRNAWLTTAATAVMTITLLIVLSTVFVHNIFNDTLQDVRDKVDISIYLRNDLTQDQVSKLQIQVQSQKNVSSVRYISPSEAQDISNQQNKYTPKQLQALGDITKDTGPLVSSSFRVRLHDLSKIDDLKNALTKDKTFNAAIYHKLPSFAGGKRDVIDTISRTATFAQQVGLGASMVFVMISVLIIFNTIRMAIFNRKEEVQMMKLIGADKSFIRGPFIVEAVMYGFFAAIIAVILVYVVLFTSQNSLEGYGINIGPTIVFLQVSPALILIGTILVGALLGIISSQLAVRRYLKV